MSMSDVNIKFPFKGCMLRAVRTTLYHEGPEAVLKLLEGHRLTPNQSVFIAEVQKLAKPQHAKS